MLGFSPISDAPLSALRVTVVIGFDGYISEMLVRRVNTADWVVSNGGGTPTVIVAKRGDSVTTVLRAGSMIIVVERTL